MFRKDGCLSVSCFRVGVFVGVGDLSMFFRKFEFAPNRGWAMTHGVDGESAYYGSKKFFLELHWNPF